MIGKIEYFDSQIELLQVYLFDVELDNIFKLVH